MNIKFGYARAGEKRTAYQLEEFPACVALMREAEKAFGLQQDPAHVHVMVRQYTISRNLKWHIDNTKLFEEPVVSVVLRCRPTSGMLLRKAGPINEESTYVVPDQPGLASCLEGAARYELGHEIPPVVAPRLSLTWRWFKPKVFAKLKTSMKESQPYKSQRRALMHDAG
eukprot:gnl/MRDRNA2_/MRDRNA2_78945_c0_seq1.p1 gnl/MRDRNA2_/MRDRNA2_78945_c0~~gnl/MRDRNA2_/MRDRNA2_78945_c0_seq1.p1  ORF type:complete len:169 (+),score=39.70 gnl/MRDRNA2_/MRDRNA2_78945_c0_seq1:334-840(+)